MDDTTFAGLIWAFGSGMSRRGALGLLAGAAGLGVRESLAKRRNRGKGKRRTRAVKTHHVTLCHYDAETATFHKVSLDSHAVSAHRHHGYDLVSAGVCCSDDDCGEGAVCQSGACVTPSTCPVIRSDGPACFWMDCDHGCCWNLNGFFADTQAGCQELDSCSPGGGGVSGGGCYQWATSADTIIAPPW